MSDAPEAVRAAARLGLFRRWRDAYREAVFRADITRLRHRVWWEPNNRWWHITETHQRLT